MNLTEARQILENSGYILEEYDMSTYKTSIPVKKRIETFLDMIDALGTNNIPQNMVDDLIDEIKFIFRTGTKKAEFRVFNYKCDKHDVERLVMMLNKAGIGAELKTTKGITFGAFVRPYSIVLNIDDDYESDESLKNENIETRLNALKYKLQGACSVGHLSFEYDNMIRHIFEDFENGKNRSSILINMKNEEEMNTITKIFNDLNFPVSFSEAKEYKTRYSKTPYLECHFIIELNA